MKYLIFFALNAVFFSACTSSPDYKAVRQEVLTEHDQIMMDSELTFRNKMKLDTLASRLDSLSKFHSGIDTVEERKQISALLGKLNKADDQMNTWMHQFEAEIGNKSQDEAIAYFEAEKKKVKSLDSLFKDVLQQSDNYLKTFQK